METFEISKWEPRGQLPKSELARLPTVQLSDNWSAEESATLKTIFGLVEIVLKTTPGKLVTDTERARASKSTY